VTKRAIAGATRAMATAMKSAMATNGNTTGSVYRCPLSSAAAAAAVGKDDKGGGGLFLYGVVVKKIGLCVFSILMFGKEAVCPDCLFVTAIYTRVQFLFEQSYLSIIFKTGK
jgi:hypothetical protein